MSPLHAWIAYGGKCEPEIGAEPCCTLFHRLFLRTNSGVAVSCGVYRLDCLSRKPAVIQASSTGS